MATLRTTKKTRHWRAWVGSVEDLVKVGRVAETLIEKRRVEILREEDDAAFRELRRHFPGEKEQTLRKTVTEDTRHRHLEAELHMQVRFADGNDEVSGALDDVVREIDRRSLQEIEFRLPISSKPEERLSIFYRRKPGSILFDQYSKTAVTLTVSSADPGWAREAFAHLSESVDLGVPWWRWIHAPFGIVLLAVVSAASLMGMAYTICRYGLKVGTAPAGNLGYVLSFAVILLIGATAVVVFAASAIRNKCFPHSS